MRPRRRGRANFTREREYAEGAARGDVEIAEADCRSGFDGEEEGGGEIGYLYDAGGPF